MRTIGYFLALLVLVSCKDTGRGKEKEMKTKGRPMTNLRMLLMLSVWLVATAGQLSGQDPNYPCNRPPLASQRYVKLPLGAIKPAGWLRSQLDLQKQGLTGNLDEFWLNNDWWKGGHGINGAKWPSKPHIAPNWLEGLIPLAYLLDDQALLKKLQPYLDYVLTASFNRESGMFGPPMADSKGFSDVAELGRLRMARGLIEYYEASSDQRVIDLLTAYFTKHLRSSLPQIKDWFNNVTLAESLVSLIWLYNKTGNAEVLEVCRLLIARPDCAQWLTKGKLGLLPIYHGYAIAHGVKYPALQSLITGNASDAEAMFNMLVYLDREYGQVGGRYAAHEYLPVRVNDVAQMWPKGPPEPWMEPSTNGLEPTHGTELCDVVELMYSMERGFEVTGRQEYLDRLEKLAFNSLPGACTGDFWAHQYVTQANQVSVSLAPRNFDNKPAANLYGLTPNYDCCLANVHQAWPRLVQHLWMATLDGGLASVVYAPATVTAKVGKGIPVSISSESSYPFDGTVRQIITALDSPALFPLYFRIPGWAEGASITVNGIPVDSLKPSMMAKIERTWRKGDRIEISLPMPVRLEKRHGNAYAVLRGPLYYVLRIKPAYRMLTYYYKGSAEWEMQPASPWNFGFPFHPDKAASLFKVRQSDPGTHPFASKDELIYKEPPQGEKRWGGHNFMPWSWPEPVVLEVKAQLIKEWGMDSRWPISAPVPENPIRDIGSDQVIELIPYGASRIRIAEFPLILDPAEQR